MKTIKRFHLLIIIASLSAVTYSCSKESDSSKLKITIQATNPTYSVKSASATPSITWLSGNMFVSKLEFEAEMSKSSTSTEKTKIKYEWKGPVKLDIFNTSSELGNITLPNGYYDEIELSVHLSKADASGDPVLYLTGNYTNASATVIPVVFTSYEDLNFKAKKEGVSITAESGAKFTSSIQIYMDQLLTGITLQQVEMAILTDGKLNISATLNQELYYQMLINMKKDQKCKFE